MLEDLLEAAKVWDKDYIPIRHPDAYPLGPAARACARGEAEEAIRLAQNLIVGGGLVTWIFAFDPQARRAGLERAAARLAERPEVLAVVPFGFLARGEATAMSDADLFVLLGSPPLALPRAPGPLPAGGDSGGRGLPLHLGGSIGLGRGQVGVHGLPLHLGGSGKGSFEGARPGPSSHEEACSPFLNGGSLGSLEGHGVLSPVTLA